MDDDLNLLRGADEPDGPGRQPWMLVTGVVLVALLTLVGVGWAVTSVLDQDGEPARAAAPTTSPAAATTVPTPADATSDPPFPTALPTTTAPTYSVPTSPVPPALTVAPTTRRPVPRVTTPPVPRPTIPPAGLRAVPDVVGQRVRTATAILQAAGFRVSVLGGSGSGRDRRRVTTQQPSAGTAAPAGSVVILLTDGL